jgi:hypothetical protein
LKSYISFFLLFLAYTSSAQFIEFGGGFGALNYSGDLTRGIKLQNTRPALTAHYRMNFSKELSVKWALTSGILSGSEQPIDAFASQRDFSFQLNMTELSSVIEYHFLDYKNEKSRIRWSPYAFGGVGFTRLSNVQEPRERFNRTQTVIPFGIGFKQLVGKRFSIDAEFGFRKTFFDWLDNTSEGDLTNKDLQYGNPNNNDWYHFAGVTLSFILYEIPCPFPYIPNQHLLRVKFR